MILRKEYNHYSWNNTYHILQQKFSLPKNKTKYMYSKIPEAFSESQLYTLVGHNRNNCMHILFYVSSFAFMLKQKIVLQTWKIYAGEIIIKYFR